MAVRTQSHPLSIASALLLFRSVLAWDSDSLTADLAWPPIGNEGTITEYGGQRVSPYVDTSSFPCANITPPTDAAKRTDFPLSSARLQFNFRNTSLDTTGYEFMIDTWLGQFSNDVNANHTGWTWVDTPVYQQISSGPQCSDGPLNMTYQIANAPTFDLQLQNSVDGSNLVGVELTLGLRIVLFNADHDNVESMYQCSYLRLVADDAPVTQDRGVCNVGPAPSSSTTGNSPVATGSPTTAPTPTSGGDTNHSGGLHRAAVVGIAVGATMGLAAILLAVGCCLLRRKRSQKARKPKPTMELGFWTVGQESGSLGLSDLQKKEKEKEAGVRVSVSSEPLPVYQREA